MICAPRLSGQDGQDVQRRAAKVLCHEQEGSITGNEININTLTLFYM